RNCSKNQVVWARCHFTGLASGIDCTTWSSGESGAARRSVSPRTARNASTRSWARLPESEKSDGWVENAAAADTDLVTMVSDGEENVALANWFPTGRPSEIGGPVREKSLPQA